MSTAYVERYEHIAFPHMVEDFISEEERLKLIDFSINCNEAFDESKYVNNQAFDRWRGKVAWFVDIAKYDKEVSSLVYEIGLRTGDYFKFLLPKVKNYVEYYQFSRWSVGDKLDPPHADNTEPDGSPNATPWRNYGMVLYLNDDFEGGELFYPNYNMQIKPKPRSLAVHTAGMECLHGVREVTDGTRHTLISFSTYNKNHVENNSGSFHEVNQ